MTAHTVELDGAKNYLRQVIGSLNALDRRGKGPLVAVLELLAQYVESTQRDIASLRQSDGGDDSFSTATVQLDEIAAEISKATNEIMSAAETIEQVAATLDRDAAAKLSDVVTKIYEACAFQDITGQRITKVVGAMESIETKVVGLARACGGAIQSQTAAPDERDEDKKLLNGPQLKEKAKSQDEIDKLFESMG